MSKQMRMIGVSAAFAALVGCGGAPQEEQQLQSGLTEMTLDYQGISGNQVSKDCAQPKLSGGTEQDWKWRIVGVPSDYMPVVMRAYGVDGSGVWRPSAVTQSGEDVNAGVCDAFGRWPLVFKPTYNANGTTTWVLWTEPLHAGDPLAGTTFKLYFVDSDGPASDGADALVASHIF